MQNTSLPSGVLTSVALVGSTLAYLWTSRNAQPKEHTISSLNIFPVKSCKGMNVKEWRLGPRGFVHDREWMIVKEDNGKFVSQREFPRMSVIEATLSKDLTKLTLSVEGKEPLILPVDYLLNKERQESTRKVELWKANFEGIDAGDKAAKWLSDVIGIAVRLVQAPKNHDRKVEAPEIEFPQGVKCVQHTNYSDFFPILLATELSLSNLNTKIEKKNHNKIDIIRFRPNIVVAGGKRPFEEDEWISIKAGFNTFYNIFLCRRCTVPNVNPELGVKDTPVSDVLAEYRLDAVTDKNIFGINMSYPTSCIGNMVKVGDSIIVGSGSKAPAVIKKKE